MALPAAPCAKRWAARLSGVASGQSGSMDDRSQLPVDATPLWHAVGRRTHPPLTDDLEVDVAVVGGGLAGLATAVELVRAGRSVAVLDARSIGSGTTGRSTAKASALQGARYRTIARLHGEEVAARYARSQTDGLRWLADRAAERGVACAWERRPAVTYATSEDGRELVDAELAAARGAGLDVEPIDADLPFPTVAAIALDDQAQFDPHALVTDLAAEVDDHPHGQVHEWSRVTGIRGHRGRVAAETTTGTVHADRVVVATLLPIIDRGLFFARSEPATSHLVALRVAGELPRGMYLGVEGGSRSLRTAPDPSGDGELLLVGGNGHDTGAGGSTLDRQAELVHWAATRFAVTEVAARWSAHDYVPADHLPWVGPATPLDPHVLVATGFEKWGMTMGAAAGMALADRILDRSDGPSASWAPIFSPNRLTPSSLPSTARINGEVAARMASGWLRPDAGPDARGDGRRRRSGLEVVGEPDGDGRDDVVLTCTHLGGVCAWNDAERTWDCPLHGSRFDERGAVLTGPATRPLRRRQRG